MNTATLVKTVNGPLFLRGYTGRLVRITGAAPSVDAANAYCEANPPASVIDTLGGLVLIADKGDMGQAFPKDKPAPANRLDPMQRSEWEGAVVRELEDLGSLTCAGAHGLLDAYPELASTAWDRGYGPYAAAEFIFNTPEA